ncbi:MAG: cytidine deaminase [Eubacterium sp.]|jgi:cytidine deaminase|nr:cytidine deaminase [Eubacterium sp.]
MKDAKELLHEAVEARKKTYSPYSGFGVGAALLTKDGVVYTGCNIENSAFTPTCCAERTAFIKAVSEGKREFIRIAVAGGYMGKPLERIVPCGVCLQVMMEFCDPQKFELVLALSEEDYEVRRLAELLPYGFSLAPIS